MKVTRVFLFAISSLSLLVDARANTYGSVEPIANPAVIDTRPLRDQDLRVREAFAERLLQCGIVDEVIKVLSSTGAITTVNDLNTHFEVGAGGFAGNTNPAYVYTVIDSGPNAASQDDVKVLTDSLGVRPVAGQRVPARRGRHDELRLPRQLRRPQLHKRPRRSRDRLRCSRPWPDRPRALRDRHERLHAVRPRLLSLQSAVPEAAVHRRLRRGGGGVRRRVQADRRRSALAVPRRRRLPRQRLDPEPRGEEYLARIPRRPPGARPHPRLPPARDPKGLCRIEQEHHDVVGFSCHSAAFPKNARLSGNLTVFHFEVCGEGRDASRCS